MQLYTFVLQCTKQSGIYAHPTTCDVFLSVVFNAEYELVASYLHLGQIKVEEYERYDAGYCEIDEIKIF